MARSKSINASNIRPDRAGLMLHIRYAANSVRSWITFKVKYRWVTCKGMVRIPWSVDLWSPHKDICLGDCVQFGAGCIVHCDAHFGNNIVIAGNVAFVGRDDHRYNMVGKTIWDSPRGDAFKIVVEDDVWIGHGAIILSGVTIGRGAVVAAGAVVTKDVPRYSIVAGNPARVVKNRFTEQQIREHESLLKCQ